MRPTCFLTASVVLLGALTMGAAPPAEGKRTQGEQPSPVVGGWSQPADGLRMRLISKKAAYAAGEALALRLEIQNVTQQTVAFVEPEFQPELTLPGAPIYGKDAGYAWVVSADPVGRRIHIRWATQARKRMTPRARLVRPGATHLVEITAPGRRERQDKLITELDRLDEPPRPQKATLYFGLGAADGGQYRLVASFDRSRDPARVTVEGRMARAERLGSGGMAYRTKGKVTPWRAQRLASPPITIRIARPAGRARNQASQGQ
jgi:hypothetical protein